MRETLERIMAADEPCRAAYAAVVEAPEGTLRSSEVEELARTGEPACRAAFQELDGINFFVPPRGGDEARRKKAAVNECAELSRVRAELLGAFAASARDESRIAQLEPLLDKADQRCRASFGRLAG